MVLIDTPLGLVVANDDLTWNVKEFGKNEQTLLDETASGVCGAFYKRTLLPTVVGPTYKNKVAKDSSQDNSSKNMDTTETKTPEGSQPDSQSRLVDTSEKTKKTASQILENLIIETERVPVENNTLLPLPLDDTIQQQILWGDRTQNKSTVQDLPWELSSTSTSSISSTASKSSEAS